jgi:hypothetical protein
MPVLARNGEQGPLGTPPGGILLRDPSAAEQDNVTIAFYQLQMGCDHHVLSAADQQERPSVVNNWSYLHVLYPQVQFFRVETCSDSHGIAK